MTNDVHFSSLLSTPGQLTDLGKLYLSLPYTGQWNNRDLEPSRKSSPADGQRRHCADHGALMLNVML